MDPLPVLITNSTNPWLPWLPLIGSTIVALVALTQVILSYRTSRGSIQVSMDAIEASREASRAANETNRLAIAASDDRELVKWRRETLVRLASEAAVAALDLERELRQGGEREPEDPIPDDFGRQTMAAGRKLGEMSEHLRMIGAVQLAELCLAIRMSVSATVEPGDAFVRAKADLAAALRDGANVESATETLRLHQKAFVFSLNTLVTNRQTFVAQAQLQLMPLTQTAE